MREQDLHAHDIDAFDGASMTEMFAGKFPTMLGSARRCSAGGEAGRRHLIEQRWKQVKFWRSITTTSTGAVGREFGCNETRRSPTMTT